MLANKGLTLLAKVCNPPDFATAITPKIGNPTAVTKNPNIEIQVTFPADCPKNGGNIKFPAPKNNEKSIKLINTKSFFDKLFTLVSPLFIL